MRRFAAIILLLFSLSRFFTSGKGSVHARVLNHLENDTLLNIHCRSGDDDIGLFTLPNGRELEWSFEVNLLGTTLFYCDVQWDVSGWHHFDAYRFYRDYERCRNMCLWMIYADGVLLGFNQPFGVWEFFDFQDS